MKTVCLFDIDGTLLSSGGAGQHAMEQALEEVFQVRGPYHDIPAAGRTDKAITKDLFDFHGLVVDEPAWNRFLDSYLQHLPKALVTMSGIVLPGVVKLLQELGERPDVSLGLLTGNLQVGARQKLEHYKIDHHFHFGGYGDHHADRDDVARVAHQAATTFLGHDIPSERLWVIGDTPADVKCGRAIGAKVLAVSTGIHSYAELETANADHLRSSLADVDEVLQVLTSY